LPNLDGLVIDFIKTNLLTGTGQMLLADVVKRTFTVSDNIVIDAAVVDAISQQAGTFLYASTRSDLNLLQNLQCVIDLKPRVSHCAFQLGMAKQ
jgi:hypothetical protein